MFEARLDRCSILKKIMDALKDLLAEGNFDCTDSGMQLQAMDISHVSLVTLYLKSDGFDKYRCDKLITLGMNIPSMVKILRCAGPDDVLTMRAHDEGDRISFLFESGNQERISDYEMKLVKIDQEQLGIPDTDYCVKMKMPSLEFARICKDLSQFGESINITCGKDGITFSSKGDIGSANIKLVQSSNPEKEEEAVLIDATDTVSLTFACQYLNKFTKATPLSVQVGIAMSPDAPLVLEYDIADFGQLRFYLAPKIEDEES